MQYVRNLSDSVSTAWNSINPATLSGAIDVIVVEQDDGSLSCSPFHVRFGKFSLLRPSDKKVEFHVNGSKQPYSMKLGEGGEAFFVFETTDNIPQSLQTSPLVSPASSPASSPPLNPEQSPPGLQEPELLDLDGDGLKPRRPPPAILYTQRDENGIPTSLHGIFEIYGPQADIRPRHDHSRLPLSRPSELPTLFRRLDLDHPTTTQR